MSDNYADVSGLEREFEFEMEGPQESDLKVTFESAPEESEFEFEAGAEEEIPDELEMEFEADDFETGDFEMDDFETSPEESDFSHEGPNDWGDGRNQEFVDRLMEISGRQFESPYESEGAIGEVLDDIEREYFFGALKRGLKKLSKNKLLRSLASKGLQMGVNQFLPGLKGAVQLASGNVNAAMKSFGNQILNSAVPGGSAMLDTVSALGLDPVATGEREAWENYVDMSREAYEHLAENLTPNAHRPAEAVRLANNAIQHAIRQAHRRNEGLQVRQPLQRATFQRPALQGPSPHRLRPRGHVKRIRVSPGQRIKLLIVGA
jgi:hypothetical protein